MPEATYIVTEDITADRPAIKIVKGNITLDLGGHTIVYNNAFMEAPADIEEWIWLVNSTNGVLVDWGGAPSFKLVNGIIKQGFGGGGADSTSKGFSAVYARTAGGEIAGITADYYGTQITGLRNINDHVHHNVILDRGWKVANRHNGCAGIETPKNANHNLLKRVRQIGFRVPSNAENYHNEVYIDSTVTNSYGIGFYKSSNSVAYENRIFGTGYLAEGIYPMHPKNINVYSNFVQMQATAPRKTSNEYGFMSEATCLRVLTSTIGYENMHCYDNTLIARGRDGGQVRGVWYHPTETVKNVVIHNNVIKAISENKVTNDYAAVVVSFKQVSYTTEPPMLGIFEDNVIISNFGNVMLGRTYRSMRRSAIFVNNTFEKVKLYKDGTPEGDAEDANYRTVRVGAYDDGEDCTDTVFIDSTLKGGASHESTYFFGGIGLGSRGFSVGWTADLIIRDETGALMPLRDIKFTNNTTGATLSARTDENGEVTLELLEYTIVAKASRTDTSDAVTTFHSYSIDVSVDYKLEQVTVTDIRAAGEPFTLNFTPSTTYMITAKANSGGAISPSGDIVVREGDSREFIIAPDLVGIPYHITEVLVDGEGVNFGTGYGEFKYEFADVAGGHTIEVNFAAAPAPVIENLTVTKLVPEDAPMTHPTTYVDITWNTDILSTASWVEYWVSPAYVKSTEENTNLAASHSFRLTELAPNVRYNYKAISQYGAQTSEVTGEFTTYDVYNDFNRFCIDNFGGELKTPAGAAETEELVYQEFGAGLTFMADGDWVHESENSAAIAFETNLPAITYVEYGLDTSYGNTTEESERHFFVHLRYLKGLESDTTYHYRLVATDERGDRIESEDRTLNTHTIEGAILVPGNLEGPQYTLNQAGAVYVLTEDIVADKGAFYITANDITLDLNGYTVTYDNGEPVYTKENSTSWTALTNNEDSSLGVHTSWGNIKNLKILNGTIRQGDNNGVGIQGKGFNPIYLKGAGTETREIAGVTIEYSGESVGGTYGVGKVHHSVLLDKGTIVDSYSYGCYGIVLTSNAHHNLFKRFRQTGIVCTSVSEYYDNELYIDSVVTNSFGISFYGALNSVVRGNRIFGTGYDAMGIGTDGSNASDIDVDSNFVQLQATTPRDTTEYTPQSEASCLRVKVGSDGNSDFHDNTVIARGRDGGIVRGVRFSPTETMGKVVFRQNTIKAIAEDGVTDGRGAVSITDAYGSLLVKSATFEDNVIISNFCNIVLGERKGYANNARFVSNKFVKAGNEERYHTIQSGYYDHDNVNNVFIDSIFENGAGYDEIKFMGRTNRCDLSVGHSLYVIVLDSKGAPMTYKDIDVTDSYSITFSARTDEEGKARLELLEYTTVAVAEAYNQALETINHTDHIATISGYPPVGLPTYMTDNEDNPYILQFGAGVSISADINKDGIVDILDLLIVARAFGAKPSDNNWNNGIADLDSNGLVNILDLLIIARNFGAAAP